MTEDDDLFGPPALIAGENKERYMRLLAAVEAEIKPKTIFQRMMARYVTDKYWEELRLRNSAAALIDGAFREAVESCIPDDPFMSLSIPKAITHQFFSGDAKAKKEAALFLEKHGLTMDLVRAKALQIVGGTLQIVDRMSVNREASRRSLRRENERHLAAANAAPERSDDTEKAE